MADSPPKDKAELLARIEAEWSALMRAGDGLSVDRMTRPGEDGWSAKDQLAHVEAWERWLLLHLLQGRPEHEAVGLEQAEYERLGVDGQNAVLFERSRDRQASEVLESLRRLHAQVLAELEPLTFDDLRKTRYPDDPKSRSLLDWVIEDTVDHYVEHRLSIESVAAD
jgi:hypothetical protein